VTVTVFLESPLEGEKRERGDSCFFAGHNRLILLLMDSFLLHYHSDSATTFDELKLNLNPRPFLLQFS